MIMCALKILHQIHRVLLSTRLGERNNVLTTSLPLLSFLLFSIGYSLIIQHLPLYLSHTVPRTQSKLFYFQPLHPTLLMLFNEYLYIPRLW